MNEKPSDDLTVIKGIGPIWQQRLRESLGVRTFRDLAALSSDEILSRLKAAGQPAPSKIECDAWISQSQELVAATNSSTKTESEIEDTGKLKKSPPGPDKWKPFATFVVEYQGLIMEGETEQRRTKVHHLENDTDENWPSIVSVELCRWMLEQTDEIASSEVEQLIEKDRARAQRDLEQGLEDQRAAAQQELEEEQTRTRQALQQELDEERTQARKELEQESKQALEDLEQELDEKRAQAELELERQLEEERTQAKQVLEQGLGEKRAQAELELKKQLEEQRSQEQHVIEQELDEKRTQAELELKKQLEEQRSQEQHVVEQELDEKRTLATHELERQLEEQRAQAEESLHQELDENRNQAKLELERQLEEQRIQALQDFEQKPVDEELQAKVESRPSEKENQPRPEPEERNRPTAQQPSDPTRVEELGVVLAISKLQAYQPSEVTEPVGLGLPGQPFSGFISSGEMFAFAVDFELAEPTKPEEIVEQGITYHVQFYANNISTGSKGHLGNTKVTTFVEGRTSYNARLTDITLKSGIYELSAVLMTIQNGHPIVNHMMVVPLLQVM